MDSVLETVRNFATGASEAVRRQLINSLNSIIYSLETPDETLHRYGHMNLQAAAIRTGFDLKLFELLAGAENAITVDEIAQKNNAAPQLTHRILRYLGSIGAVAEVSSNEYAANHVTKNLADEVVQAGLKHFLLTVGPQYDSLPVFLKRTGYKNPANELQTAFQDAWKTPLHTFEWFGNNPEHLSYFNDYMAGRRQSDCSWLTAYPLLHEIQGWDAKDGSEALFVNVGGGIGHQCKQFRDTYPDIPGKVILQDLAHSIAQSLSIPGVINMEHNFFQPQPIKGAKFYYFRGVLHDHPPQQVQRILEQTRKAMSPESVLLIDEMILPETKVNNTAASIDMTMLTACAGMERTTEQWKGTFEQAGLELVGHFMYAPLHYEAVMHVKLPTIAIEATG